MISETSSPFLVEYIQKHAKAHLKENYVYIALKNHNSSYFVDVYNSEKFDRYNLVIDDAEFYQLFDKLGYIYLEEKSLI